MAAAFFVLGTQHEELVGARFAPILQPLAVVAVAVRLQVELGVEQLPAAEAQGDLAGLPIRFQPFQVQAQRLQPRFLPLDLAGLVVDLRLALFRCHSPDRLTLRPARVRIFGRLRCLVLFRILQVADAFSEGVDDLLRPLDPVLQVGDAPGQSLDDGGNLPFQGIAQGVELARGQFVFLHERRLDRLEIEARREAGEQRPLRPAEPVGIHVQRQGLLDRCRQAGLVGGDGGFGHGTCFSNAAMARRTLSWFLAPRLPYSRAQKEVNTSIMS